MRVPEWLRYRTTGPMSVRFSRAVKGLGIGLIVLGALLLLAELGFTLIHYPGPFPSFIGAMPLWRLGVGCALMGGVIVLLVWSIESNEQKR